MRLVRILLLSALVLCAQEKKEDTFFAGTVASWDAQKVTVTRSVAAKKEERTFRVTPETKVEGKLRTKVRVTVRYTSDENGDIATLIVVRNQARQK